MNCTSFLKHGKWQAMGILPLFYIGLLGCSGNTVRTEGFRVTSVGIARAPTPGSLNIDATVTIERTSANPDDRLAVPVELWESDAFLRFGDDLLDKGTAFVAPQRTDTTFRFTMLDCSPTLTLKGPDGDSGEGGPGILGIGSDNAELYVKAGGNSSSQLHIAPCNP